MTTYAITEAQLSDLDSLKVDIANALQTIVKYEQENVILKAQLEAKQLIDTAVQLTKGQA